MVKKVLPPLNEQNQVPNIAGSGEWKAEDATFLEKLAKGLKMSGEEVVSAADINSVPDVWARVLIVRNGLVDNSKSIVDEWRGTLALLALAPYYKHIYDLNSNIVNIQDIKNNPYTNAGSADGKYSHIGKILFDVKPQDTMAQGQDWNAVGVLNFNKTGISVWSPIIPMSIIICQGTFPFFSLMIELRRIGKLQSGELKKTRIAWNLFLWSSSFSIGSQICLSV